MEQRMIAYQCLRSIMIDHEYSNLCLRNALTQVEAQKRPQITQLVYGTLENYRYVRWNWEPFVKHMPKEEIAILLDMAVYELLWLKEKPYACIHEVVSIAKKRFSSASGMVNAVLRRVSEQGMRELPPQQEEALGIKTSHPTWLIKMWNKQYGTEICKKICEGNLVPRKRVGRVNTCKISRKALLAQEPAFTASPYHKDAFTYEQGNIAYTTWFQDGYVSIQDEASQMVAPLLDPQPGERILDVCSAPGTKACHIAQLMQDEGVIICGDIHEHRVALIEEGAKRLGLTSIQPKCMDATNLSEFSDASFDRVLCDVPCSGYGTLSRKSDIKVHMSPDDMDALIPIQAQILHRSAQFVKSSGILVYSTCTLNKKENEMQIMKFLKTHDDFILLEEHTIFPFTYDCDGFYMAKLQRKEAGML